MHHVVKLLLLLTFASVLVATRPRLQAQAAPVPAVLQQDLQRMAQRFRATALFGPAGSFPRVYGSGGPAVLARLTAIAPLTDRAMWRPFFASMIPVVGCADLATPIILFVSPFHDLALWTEWNRRGATLRSAVLVPGDLLLVDRPATATLEPTPGWMRQPSAASGDVFDAAYREFALEMRAFRARAGVGCTSLPPPPAGVDDVTPRNVARARLRMTAGIDAALARMPLSALHAPIATYSASGNGAALAATFRASAAPGLIAFLRTRREMAAKLVQSPPLLPVFSAIGTGATPRGFVVYADALDGTRYALVSGGTTAVQPLRLTSFNFIP